MLLTVLGVCGTSPDWIVSICHSPRSDGAPPEAATATDDPPATPIAATTITNSPRALIGATLARVRAFCNRWRPSERSPTGPISPRQRHGRNRKRSIPPTKTPIRAGRAAPLGRAGRRTASCPGSGSTAPTAEQVSPRRSRRTSYSPLASPRRVVCLVVDVTAGRDILRFHECGCARHAAVRLISSRA